MTDLHTLAMHDWGVLYIEYIFEASLPAIWGLLSFTTPLKERLVWELMPEFALVGYSDYWVCDPANQGSKCVLCVPHVGNLTEWCVVCATCWWPHRVVYCMCMCGWPHWLVCCVFHVWMTSPSGVLCVPCMDDLTEWCFVCHLWVTPPSGVLCVPCVSDLTCSCLRAEGADSSGVLCEDTVCILVH